MKNRLELTCVLKCSLSWVHLIVTTLFRRSTGVHIRGGVPLVVAAAWSSSAAAPAAVGSVGGAGEAAASATEVAVATTEGGVSLSSLAACNLDSFVKGIQLPVV